MKRLLAATVALASIAVVGAVPVQAHARPGAGPGAGAGVGAGTDPRGTIAWHDCMTDDSLTGFECGTLTVPLDWDNLANPANAAIELAVHRATSPQRLGALTFNPGGPGESGLASATGVLKGLPEQVANRFDFVAWDPRGVGISQPQLSGCLDSSEALAGRADPYTPPATGPVDWDALAATNYEALAEALPACLAINEGVAPYLGTYYVIRDLDAMRAALGEEQWNLWGMSYGTRIGYWYARQFPDRLRTLVLDGAWSPNMTMTGWMNAESWNYATGQAVFASLFGKKMGYRLQRVIDGLDKRTITVNGNQMSRWAILPAIFTNISYQSMYPDVVSTITLAYNALYGKDAKASGQAMMAPLQRLQARENPNQALNIFFINCRDLAGYPTVAEIGRAARIAAANNSVAAGQNAIAKGTLCAGLPQEFTHGFAPLNTSLSLRTPPVVINSLGDTRTEYDFGRTMANYLAGSALITYNSTQHVSYRQVPSRCISRPVTDYLLTQTVPSSRLCAYAAIP